MFIFIPHSLGQLTGWKAIAVCALIVTCIGLGIWSKLGPQEISNGD